MSRYLHAYKKTDVKAAWDVDSKGISAGNGGCQGRNFGLTGRKPVNEPTPIREYEQAVYVYWYGPHLPTVKIGHSNSPDKRIAQLGNDTGVPDHLASFAAIVWLDRRREQVEARAHAMAASFRKSGEWFELTASAALGYIISAAEELNIRYEVEDRASLLAVTRENLRIAAEEAANEEASASSMIEKWGPNWREKEAAQEATEEAAANADEAALAAEEEAAWAATDADEADEPNRAATKTAAQTAQRKAAAAQEAAWVAREAADAAANDTTEGYRARVAKFKSRKATPARTNLTDAQQAAIDAEGDARRVAFWNAKWGRDPTVQKGENQSQQTASDAEGDARRAAFWKAKWERDAAAPKGDSE